MSGSFVQQINGGRDVLLNMAHFYNKDWIGLDWSCCVALRPLQDHSACNVLTPSPHYSIRVTNVTTNLQIIIKHVNTNIRVL